jgi:hypothetical protein
MEEIERGMREIAHEMKQALGDSVSETDCYQLVSSTYKSMRSHNEAQMETMEPEAIIRVLRRQIGELVKLGRARKLLAKRQHIAPAETD